MKSNSISIVNTSHHVEVFWRMFSFPIHRRTLVVERLYFHLLNEQSILFNYDEDIDLLLSQPSVKESMFTSWLQENKIYIEDKNLTYIQFVTKFVYISSKRCWQPRK